MDYVIFLLNYIEIVRISSALRPIFHICISTFFPLKISQVVAFKRPINKISFGMIRLKCKDPKLMRENLLFLICLWNNLSIELVRSHDGLINECIWIGLERNLMQSAFDIKIKARTGWIRPNQINYKCQLAVISFSYFHHLLIIICINSLIK
jgi:hypothetical protein